MGSKFISVILSLAVVLGLLLVPAMPVANVALANPDYNLTVKITGLGNVTINGTTPSSYPDTTTYPDDTVVTINATPDANYHFVNWTGDVGTIGDVNASNTTITMNNNYSVTANFAINQYNLTIDSTDGGNVSDPGEGVFGPYDYGTVVSLTATPDANYHFVNWTGDVGTIGDVNASNTTINMTGDYSVTANFAINTCTLTIDSSDGGNVTVPGEGEFGPYDYGTVVTITATPDAGSYFVNWTGNTGTIADPNAATTTITMNDNYFITANFGWLPVVEKKKVVEPASFTASYLQISPPQVSPNQPVEISINVANTGGESASRAVILYVNNVAEQSQTLTLAPGSAQNVFFTVSKATPGTYEVLLEGQNGQFVVKSTSVFGGGGLGTGGIIAIIVVLLALIVGIIFVMRGARGGA